MSAERKLFGTDGVRGEAGTFLSAELATALGRATTASLEAQRPQVLIVRDTRESGPMLEAALAAGVAAAGGDALLGGVLPTPAAAILVKRLGLDLAAVGRLTFRAPDLDRYPALALAWRVMEEGGLMGAAFNAAKEVALDAFLARAIGFTDMASVVSRTLDRLTGDATLPTLSPSHATPGLEDVLEADRIARLRAGEVVESM